MGAVLPGVQDAVLSCGERRGFIQRGGPGSDEEERRGSWGYAGQATAGLGVILPGVQDAVLASGGRGGFCQICGLGSGDRILC